MLTCFQCGKKGWWADRVSKHYVIHGFDIICQSCGENANSFVNYWGVKKPEDVNALKQYFNSGFLVQKKFNALMNAGYM